MKVIPLYKVFTKTIKVAGVPEQVFCANLTLAIITVMFLGLWQLAPLFYVFHKVIKYLVSKDDNFIEILTKGTLKKYLSY